MKPRRGKKTPVGRKLLCTSHKKRVSTERGKGRSKLTGLLDHLQDSAARIPWWQFDNSGYLLFVDLSITCVKKTYWELIMGWLYIALEWCEACSAFQNSSEATTCRKALNTYPYQCCRMNKITSDETRLHTTTDQVDVVEVALSCTGADHFRNPAKAFSSSRAGSNGRESLLDRLKSNMS